MESKFNVLIIEDDEKTFKTLKNILTGVDYELYRAFSAKEALNLLKKMYFIVVISELHLPDMDAAELVRRIKKINHRINVIAITAYSFANLAVTALQEGAYSYLLKPLNAEETRLILERAIRNSCLLIQAGKKKYYEDMSNLDGLTGIYNHRYFLEKLNWQIEYLRRFPQVFSLFMIDLDDFKKYNDTKGHPQGDKALCDTAQLFVNTVRENDMVFRYGGEEFVIIMPQTLRRHLQRIGERLIEKVRSRLPLTISVGAAAFPDDAQTKDELLNRADKALYRAKRTGKDRICVYDEGIDK